MSPRDFKQMAVKYFQLAANRKSRKNGHFVYYVKCWPSGKTCAQ